MRGDRRPSLGWTVANVVAALLFAASVAVQVNDPDPLPWMAIYGGAAIIALLECTRRVRPVFPALLSVTALGWAATVAPRVIGKVPFTEMFGAFEMKNVGVEESREMYGLLLVALWMAAVALAGWRRRKPG
jgi:transmembrane protein TMEM220